MRFKDFVKRSPLAPVVRSSRAVAVRSTFAKARLVRNPIRFLALETGHRGRLAEHHLLHLPIDVTVRHRTRDTDILSEMLWAYQPPGAICLPASGTVLDIGGNIGLFALWALGECPGCSVISYEPDPSNLAVLARNRASVGGDRWTVQPVAVSNWAGESRFASGSYADSRVSAAGDVLVTVVDIFQQPHATFMKIDIEGSEWDILRDPRLSTLPADIVVMEWHRHATDGTEGDASEATARLRHAGFAIEASDFDAGRDHGVVWAMRR
jgi:FkbM family methyltransferase